MLTTQEIVYVGRPSTRALAEATDKHETSGTVSAIKDNEHIGFTSGELQVKWENLGGPILPGSASAVALCHQAAVAVGAIAYLKPKDVDLSLAMAMATEWLSRLEATMNDQKLSPIDQALGFHIGRVVLAGFRELQSLHKILKQVSEAEGGYASVDSPNAVNLRAQLGLGESRSPANLQKQHELVAAVVDALRGEKNAGIDVLDAWIEELEGKVYPAAPAVMSTLASYTPLFSSDPNVAARQDMGCFLFRTKLRFALLVDNTLQPDVPGAIARMGSQAEYVADALRILEMSGDETTLRRLAWIANELESVSLSYAIVRAMLHPSKDRVWYEARADWLRRRMEYVDRPELLAVCERVHQSPSAMIGLTNAISSTRIEKILKGQSKPLPFLVKLKDLIQHP